MEDLIKVVTETPFKVISTLLTGAVVAALGFLSAPFRRAVFYKRHDFSLPGEPAGCEWDIQWENLRVTLGTSAIHNDYLENVTIKTNDKNPGMTKDKLGVGEAYIPVSGAPPWFLKLGSIVRTRAGGRREYLVNVSVLRRRF